MLSKSKIFSVERTFVSILRIVCGMIAEMGHFKIVGFNPAAFFRRGSSKTVLHRVDRVFPL